MVTSSAEKIRVLLCGATHEELAAIGPRLRGDDSFALEMAGSLAGVVDTLVHDPPHVLVLGTSAEPEERRALVRTVRRDGRLACVRIVWMAREAGIEQALESGSDDICAWPAPLEGFVARLREQGAESNVRRIGEREAALQAELSRVDEALSRAEAEEAALRAQLSVEPSPPLEDDGEGPALRPSRQHPFGPHPTLEFGALERRLVTMLRDQHLAQPRIADLSALVIGIDGWDALVSSRGPRLGERLLDAIGQLVHSLLDAADAVERLGPGQLCVLLPGANEAEAVRLARDVCAQVASAPVKVAPRPFQPTVSVGVATLETGGKGSPFDLVEWARAAYAIARERGGNRWWVKHATPSSE